MINTVLTFATFKKVYNIPINLWIFIPIVLLFGFIIGYLDYEYISPYYTRHANKKNNLQDQITRIEQAILKQNDTNNKII